MSKRKRNLLDELFQMRDEWRERMSGATTWKSSAMVRSTIGAQVHAGLDVVCKPQRAEEDHGDVLRLRVRLQARTDIPALHLGHQDIHLVHSEVAILVNAPLYGGIGVQVDAAASHSEHGAGDVWRGVCAQVNGQRSHILRVIRESRPFPLA